MVALTRDFHVVAACVAARVSAVLFSWWYIAQTRYVCALSSLLICHYDFSFSTSADCMQLSKRRVGVNTMLFQGLCDQQIENMKRARCRHADSDVGISTPFTLAGRQRAPINAGWGPGALPTPLEKIRIGWNSNCNKPGESRLTNLFQIGLDDDETAHQTRYCLFAASYIRAGAIAGRSPSAY